MIPLLLAVGEAGIGYLLIIKGFEGADKPQQEVLFCPINCAVPMKLVDQAIVQVPLLLFVKTPAVAGVKVHVVAP